MPFVILFGGYHLTYHLGQLTNYILKAVTNYRMGIHLSLVGLFGLCIFAITLFFLAVIAKVLWFWAGKIMEWYDSKQGERQAARDVRITENREREFRASLRRNFAGGEALQHPVSPHPIHQPTTDRIEELRNLMSPDEELDEDLAYRQRIGVEE